MKRRVSSLATLLLWVVLGFGFAAVAGFGANLAAATGFAVPGSMAREPLALSHAPGSMAGSDDLTAGLSPRAQTDTASPSSDRDYDGLTDAVETDGWWNAAGFFTTDPLDPDGDDDGLTDGREKLFDTDPLDDHSPGIYVEYQDHLQTRQYFAKDAHSTRPWGWQQYGTKRISLDAVVVRRGATFSVGGPAGATVQIDGGSLTPLTSVQDSCTGRWHISVPPDGTVGKYRISLQEGSWSKSLDLYVIFELPTSTSSFTEGMVDAFLYDDDPNDLRDEKGILLGDYKYTSYNYPGTIPSGEWINAGNTYRFDLQQFEPFVFEDHVIEAINGSNEQWDAACDLIAYADKVTRFDNPRVLYSSWSVLHPGVDDSNQCSNIAGLLVAFARSAGIPARPLIVDWAHSSFDHAAELWLDGTWYAARAYRVREPAGCGWDCEYGHVLPMSRYDWGIERYRPWHSGGDGNGSTIMVADENWTWLGTEWVSGLPGHEYRWPSWDWGAIVRLDWFDSLFAPYWSYWGWKLEPLVTGTPPDDWPAATVFTIDAAPVTQTVELGGTTGYTISLEAVGGFDDGVALSVAGLPADTTADFNPGSLVPPGSSALSVFTSASAPTGTYTLTITGEGGGLLRRTGVDMIVSQSGSAGQPPSGLSLGTSPGSFKAAADAQAGLIVRGVDDYGVDLDGDGHFEQLVVEVEVNAAHTGTYWAHGQLGSDRQTQFSIGTGGLIAGSVVRMDLVEGVNTVQIPFDGLRISAAREDGPYVLQYLAITDVKDPEPDDFANSALAYWSALYRTKAYGVYRFQNRGAVLSRQIAGRGLDRDNKGRYRALALDVGLEVFEPGTYTVHGDLYDRRERFVAQASWTGAETTASLQFDRLPGGRGPYMLKDLVLLNAEGEVIDRMFAAYTTPPAFRTWGANRIASEAELIGFGAQEIVPNAYSDSAQDLDGDGLYDLLVIDVQVEVEEVDQYRLEGWLEGDGGSLISWAGSDPVDLAAGTHTLSLMFSGPAIRAHNVDGAFTLMALKLLRGDGYEVVDGVDAAYTTLAYTSSQFDELPHFPQDHVVLFEDHMEAGAGNWIADVPWALATARSHSPTHAWTDSPDGDYADDADVSLTTKPVHLRGGDMPILQFQTCYSLQSDRDYGIVEISTNEGVVWTRVATYTGSTTHWSREMVDLDVAGGADTVQVRFRLNTDGDVTADGWYVDDVAVFTIEEVAPVAFFSTSSPDYLGDVTTFSNLSTGGTLSFEWDLGDNSPIVTSVHPTHTYATTGTFTVVLTATNSVGSDTASDWVVIEDPPPASLDLRGYWTLDEGGGERQDRSSYANHLADYNTVGSAPGQVGQAADLESDNGEYLSIGDGAHSGLDLGGSLTLVGWMNAERLERWQILAAKYEFVVDNRAYRLDLRPGNLVGFIVSPDGGLSSEHILEASPSFSLRTGTWYHVAGVFDAEQRRLSVYLDGELIGSRSVTYDRVYDCSAPFMLGADLKSGSVVQFFDGRLDEWRVYSRALSESEIDELMATSSPTPTPTPTATPLATATPTPTPMEAPSPSLRGYWTLDEGGGERWDSSSYANHLADYNTVGSAPGQVGQAADLESSNGEYLSIGDGVQSGLDLGGSLTLVGWMNAERLERWQILAAKYEFVVDNRAYRLDLRPGNLVGFIVSPDGGLSSEHILEASPSFSLRTGTWYHVAGVFDAEQRRLSVYLDGELIGSRSVTYDRVYDCSAPFMLGADVKSGDVVQFFDGRLDEWRVYSRALSESEIEELIDTPTP